MAGPRYEVALASPAAHRFQVTLTVEAPAAGQCLSLPVWIPGSYMVREFAKHLSGMTASQAGQPCGLTQLDKAQWQVDCVAGVPLVVTYSVYAFDPSVRTAWLDDQRAFFNPSSLCLRVQGQEAQPHRLSLAGVPADWHVATEMPCSGTGYEAATYDELLDHPFEIGAHWQGEFVAEGVPHRVVVAGAWPSFDGARLLADVQRICEAQIRFWGEAPFQRYSFLLWAVDDGHGGLEHRSSTALICARRELPTRTEPAVPVDGYVRLLGLFSHEYFHAWNVKRLRPAVFGAFDYQRENYTELLWFFEGFTSYYDELMLLRAGLVDAPRYVQLLNAGVQSVWSSPGRQVQPLASASFEAWTKYYRPDENSPNTQSNYYAQGALVALCLDLSLRQAGSSLDALMRQLWQHTPDGLLTEAQILTHVAQLGGPDLAAQLQRWVHTTEELPLPALLQHAGVRWSETGRATMAQRLGLRVRESALTGVTVTHVLSGGAAEQAGVNARDELLGANGWRLRRLDDLAHLQPTAADPVRLLVSRDQRLVELTLTVPAAASLDVSPCISLGISPAGSADGSATAAPSAGHWPAG